MIALSLPPAPDRVAWMPQAGPQTALLACPIEDVLFGGARGGGKTDGLIGDWLQHASDSCGHAQGIFFRRTYDELDEVQARCEGLFPKLGAKYEVQARTWHFPDGTYLKLRYLERDADASHYQGHEYSWIGIDEAGNFPSPSPIDRLYACLRSKHGIPCVIRLSANPRGAGHAWLKKRYVLPAPPYTPVYDAERMVTRVFIPSRVWDNQFINPAEYARKLHAVGTPSLVRAWLDGNWDDDDDGGLFLPGLIQSLEMPTLLAIKKLGLRPTQYWDLATREKQRLKDDPSDDPDYSACATVARDELDRFIILHLWRGQVNSGDLLKQMHVLQRRFNCPVKAEKGAIHNILSGVLPMMNRICGRDLAVLPIGKGSKDKVEHSMPLQMIVNSGNCYVPADADFVEALKDELRIFPRQGAGIHDDQVDALSYAAEDLRRQRTATPPIHHNSIPYEMTGEDAERVLAAGKEPDKSGRWW